MDTNKEILQLNTEMIKEKINTVIIPALIKFLPHLLLILALLGLAMFLYHDFPDRIDEKFGKIEEIAKPMQDTDEDQKLLEKTYPDIKADIHVRLLGQYNRAYTQGLKYYYFMKFYISQYYMSISIILVFGLMAAIALAIITRQGMNDVKKIYITLFFTATAITTYFMAFPQVFQHSQNIADNKNLYLQNIAIKNEIISYFATRENVKGERLTPGSFIHYIDKQLEITNKVPIGFDATKIPNYKDVLTIK